MSITEQLTEAWQKGRIGVALPRCSPALLCRWKSKHRVKATGKHIFGSYIVVFWGNLLNQIKGE